MAKNIYIDSCILFDVLKKNSEWWEWSCQKMTEIRATANPVISPVVFSEVSAGFDTLRGASAAIKALNISIEDMPIEALYIAGKKHREYRQRGGAKIMVLPDFFIGAQALVDGSPLITRDVRRFKTYFPKLKLITPEV